MDLGFTQLAAAFAIGLCAGGIGGLAGIGGSLIMLPGLGLILGYDEPERTRQHLYMAAAMGVNVLVALPATRQHQKAGVIRRDIVKVVMPSMALAIIAGTLLSNLINGHVLTRVLAAFIAGYCALNFYRVLRGHAEKPMAEEHLSTGRLVGTGVAAGLVGGLLGLGGGVVMVPMLQLVAGVPLRMAIGTSSAVMCLTGLIGAAVKMIGLGGHGQAVSDALQLIVVMGPGAMAGAMIGARLTHWLPLNAVRAVVSTLLLASAVKLADVI